MVTCTRQMLGLVIGRPWLSPGGPIIFMHSGVTANTPHPGDCYLQFLGTCIPSKSTCEADRYLGYLIGNGSLGCFLEICMFMR